MTEVPSPGLSAKPEVASFTAQSGSEQPAHSGAFCALLGTRVTMPTCSIRCQVHRPPVSSSLALGDVRQAQRAGTGCFCATVSPASTRCGGQSVQPQPDWRPPWGTPEAGSRLDGAPTPVPLRATTPSHCGRRGDCCCPPTAASHGRHFCGSCLPSHSRSVSPSLPLACSEAAAALFRLGLWGQGRGFPKQEGPVQVEARPRETVALEGAVWS